MFYGNAPSDYAPIGAGANLNFPNDGPTAASGIVRTGPATFQLNVIGKYRVSWQASIAEAGQLQLFTTTGSVVFPGSTVGRATGTSQIVGDTMITTTVINQIISVKNPGLSAITVTDDAGGASAVSPTLMIVRLA